MTLALRESEKAPPACRPNPPVGCVIVLDDALLSVGHTQPPGQPHAEIMALRAATASLAAASLYVTLEPCSFHGRTPSCAAALIRAGIGRVYVGMIDPHPKNRGRGIAMLRAAGIPVEVGVLGPKIEAALSRYLIRE